MGKGRKETARQWLVKAVELRRNHPAHFAASGILDELRIMVCPIVLGPGQSLFEDLNHRISLTPGALAAVRFR